MALREAQINRRMKETSVVNLDGRTYILTPPEALRDLYHY